MFLKWMKQQNQSDTPSTATTPVNDEDLIQDFEIATEAIMSIFSDPFFQSRSAATP